MQIQIANKLVAAFQEVIVLRLPIEHPLRGESHQHDLEVVITQEHPHFSTIQQELNALAAIADLAERETKWVEFCSLPILVKLIESNLHHKLREWYREALD